MRKKAQKQSNIRGVNWNEHENRWVARFTYQHRSYLVGYFKEIPDAVKALHETKQIVLQGEYDKWLQRK
jgi:hypothetical protein